MQRVDKYFVGSVLQQINLEDHIICITADHSTPCNLKAHSDDPVPVLIAGNSFEGDKVEKFSEKACIKGKLGVLYKGTELMPKLVNHVKY